MKPRLFTPGPTPVPERILLRMAEAPLYHRSDEFRAVMRRVNAGLQYVFQTARPVLTLGSSGTGAMESVVASLFRPGDTVITVNGGKFGARWTHLARAFGLKAEEIEIPWGRALMKEELAASLKAHGEAAAVFLTHCETSTGTLTDVAQMARIIREHSRALVCVDGISSVGALEMQFDLWGIDVCVCASQKGFMVPPGLAFVALGERAESAARDARAHGFYFDLLKALASWKTADTPWTPPVSLIAGLDAALEMIREEGIENVWRRHRRLGAALRSGMTGLDLRLFSQAPSDSMTAVWIPEGIPWRQFSDHLRKESGITVSGGQEEYARKIFRVAHMGYCDAGDIVEAVSGIERALSALGHRFPSGAGLEATQRALAEES